MGAPAGLSRRPQNSELIRSVSCQSGPLSSRTTFLPALASTDAYTEPEAPAPTMTTSTFSFAMSPPPLRRDVGHVRHAESLVAVRRRVHDIDGVAAQHAVDERPGRALPAFGLVLPHQIDEVALVARRQHRELAREGLVAAGVDRANRCAIEIGERRLRV